MLPNNFKIRFVAYWLNIIAYECSMFFGNTVSQIIGVSNLLIAIILWYSINEDFKNGTR